MWESVITINDYYYKIINNKKVNLVSLSRTIKILILILFPTNNDNKFTGIKRIQNKDTKFKIKIHNKNTK